MILLDTNVISEPLKPQPDAVLIGWLNVRPIDDLYLPAIVVAELHYGWSVLPAGRRKSALKDAIEGIVDQFNRRILPFDLDAAVAYGPIMAKTRAAGTGMSVMDGQIAAIANAHSATLATRNTRHFANAGIQLMNPWNGDD